MRAKLVRTVPFLLFASLISACTPSFRSSPYAWQLVLEVSQPGTDKASALGLAMSIVERRLELASVKGFKVEAGPQEEQLSVKLPAGVDLARLKHLLTTHGRLEIVSVVSPSNPAPLQTYTSQEQATASVGDSLPENRRVLPYPESEGQNPSRWLVVGSPPIVDGSQLREAHTEANMATDGFMISFTLKPEGAIVLDAWTGNHINSYLGVVWNGEVKTVAYVKGRISDQGQLSGRFTRESAEDIALILNSGALPGPIRIVSEQPIN